MSDELAKQQIQEWYEQYSDEIYRFVLLMIGDQDQAKDVTQDTFLKAYQSMDYFQGNTSDKNWLYKIARNGSVDYIRKKKPIRFILDSISTIPSTEYCPEKISLLGEKEEQLYRSLHKLKRSYREVIILRKIKELSIQETADVLGWNESKVKTTLFRGQAALKKQMVEEGYTHETM
ncbi:RNA polymerase sigma factor [Bacillus alkalicellulosilyticus]|uniref:RNA polymerase sigma factor n=1 Tax=Alkalihalobacterium alkalicellulosilyticum TaxID=1912214 RepID=UPI001FE58BC2|nr:RNA polymerase sigma factor [Bacillus alkalicellulosilyticus]